jgi:hypothetical protein
MLSYGPMFYFGDILGCRVDGMVGQTLSVIYWPCKQVEGVRPYLWYNLLFVPDSHDEPIQLDIPN